MKYLLIAVISLAFAVVLAEFALADATGSPLWWSTHAGVTCGFGTGPQGRGVACLRTNRQGYAVTLTGTRVVVWLNGKKVFSRPQP